MRASVGALFALVAVFVLLGAAASCGPLSETTARTWMSRLSPKASLLTITLPGTHDSGSYNLTSELIGVPPLLDEAIAVADALHVNVGGVIDGWAKSQVYNLYEQFSRGIRYADIRAVWFDNAWHTNHGVVLGSLLVELLDDAAAFAMEQPTEVLVLEISHTLSYSEPDADALAQLVAMITNAFGALLVPVGTPLATPIGRLVSANTRVLVTVDDPAVVSPVLWPGTTIVNSYANSPVLSTMEAYNDAQAEAFVSASQNGSLAGQLFKMSWTLTPNAATVLGMLVPDKPKTLLELAQLANDELALWVSALQAAHANWSYPTLGNILIIDSFETSPIVAVVQDWPPS